jgi:general stress protein 26
MKSNVPLPMPDIPLTPVETYEIDESDDIFGQMKQLIDGAHPGVLTTIDAAGRPQARWMATLSLEKLPHIYTLSSSKSRKVAEIEANPEVNWMFSNADLSLVVNLSGRARILRDGKSLVRVWNHVKSKSNAYFLKNCTEGSAHVAIETTVRTVECTTPKNALRFRVDIGKLRPKA